MGWDITLQYEGETPEGRKLAETCQVQPFTFGSVLRATHDLQPIASCDADMSLTYNYSKHYYGTVNDTEGLRWLHGKRAEDTIAQLQHAVNVLGTTVDVDYWASTPGNAGAALAILLDWANAHPDARWEVR